MRSLRHARRALWLVVTLTLVLIAVGFLALGLGPRTGRYRVLTVQSGSMRPTLPVGSLIVVTPLPLADVRAQDIITFQLPTNRHVLETHRVVKVLQLGPHPLLQTKGDANTTPDPWRLRLLAGPAWRVRVVVPDLGYLLAWLREPWVRIITIVVAPLLLAVLWLSDIWRVPTLPRISWRPQSPASGDPVIGIQRT